MQMKSIGVFCCAAMLVVNLPELSSVQSHATAHSKQTCLEWETLVRENRALESDAAAQVKTDAIRELGKLKCASSIDILVSEIEFMRPDTEEEKAGAFFSPRGFSHMYPAILALASVGKQAGPALVSFLANPETSQIARRNAEYALMEAYRYDRPAAISLLVRSAGGRTNLSSSVLMTTATDALRWCTPPERKSCEAALKAAQEEK